MPGRRALTEHHVVPDTFVTGLARIERVGGGNLRFVFTTRQHSTVFSDGRIENVITAKIVINRKATATAAKAALLAVFGVGGVVGDIAIDAEEVEIEQHG